MQSAADPLSVTFAALADPTRRAILARLAAGPATVKELSAPFSMSGPAVSKHLSVLRRAGLVTIESRGRERIYRLAPAPRGLDQARAYFDRLGAFWDTALESFKSFAEQEEPR